MIPELGCFALILALGFAILQATVPLLGSLRVDSPYTHVAKPAAWGQFIFLSIAYLCLTYSFAVNDFSVLYVANHSSIELPLGYTLTAVWGGHEGSMLLWVLMLAGWTVSVALLGRQLPDQFLSKVLAVMGWVSIGLLLFLLLTSNPFTRLLPEFPDNGRDLNPLLQDPGLMIHPPMLYLGYVGFTVVFAFAIAALLEGKLDRHWVRWVRPWTLAAWSFLTLGIVLGSWWAYRELGWGGWWFWDPVENVSFLPWLAGTALIHSLVVTEKRGAFTAWTLLLAIIVFALSLLGTFIVRSGLLTSVHAFAVDPQRGLFMLVLLFITLGVSLTLYAWCRLTQTQEEPFNLLSRETLLLFNNVLLTVALVTVLLGTLYPLIIEALGLGKLSVGAPYFNMVFVPLMAPLLFLLGLGPHAQWRAMQPQLLLNRIKFVFVISISVGILLPWVMTGTLFLGVVLGVSLAVWIIGLTVLFVWRRWPAVGLSQWGMIFAHIGVAVCVLGITISTYYSIERDVRMAPGDTVELHHYAIHFDDLEAIDGPNYRGVQANFSVEKAQQPFTVLTPQKKFYPLSDIAMTDTSIHVNLWRDLYIALAEPLDDSAWAVRLYYKPMVRWIWLGGLLILLGGVVAAWANRERKSYVVAP